MKSSGASSEQVGLGVAPSDTEPSGPVRGVSVPPVPARHPTAVLTGLEPRSDAEITCRWTWPPVELRRP